MAIRAFKAIASAFRRAMAGVPRFIAPLPTSAAVSPPAVNRAILGNMTAITIPITRHGGLTRWQSLKETTTNIARSEENTSELPSQMRSSHDVFYLKQQLYI